MIDWRSKSDKEKPKKKRGEKKFIEKTELLYKKQVPRNTIYREALILLKELKVSGQTRDIKHYTMKSLILAQDER